MDPEAELFRVLYPRLRRYAAVVGSRRDDPDDLVHDALVRLLRTRSLSAVTNPEAYLRRTIVNLVIDRSRRESVHQGVIRLVAADDDVVDQYPSDLSVLENLSAVDRSILFMVDVEQRSFAETAEVVGCSAGAARLRASRARRRLRQIIKESNRD